MASSRRARMRSLLPSSSASPLHLRLQGGGYQGGGNGFSGLLDKRFHVLHKSDTRLGLQVLRGTQEPCGALGSAGHRSLAREPVQHVKDHVSVLEASLDCQGFLEQRAGRRWLSVLEEREAVHRNEVTDGFDVAAVAGAAGPFGVNPSHCL